MLTDKEFEAVKDTFSDKEVDIKDSESMLVHGVKSLCSTFSDKYNITRQESQL